MLKCSAALLLFISFIPHTAFSSGAINREHERKPLSIPEYVRGPNYKYFLTREQRERGMGYQGSKNRLKAVLKKLEDGKTIHVTTVGGSVTAGLHGYGDGHSWPDYLFNYLNDTFPGQVVTTNGAVPGTISSYMSACVNIHVPQDTDLVLVEYTVNDIYQTHPLFLNEYRRAYERLLRKLLNFPHDPAVILMHSYNWMSPPIGLFWNNIEREYMELSYYYDLPSLSLKASCYHAMVEGKEGFYVGKSRQEDEKGLANKSFFLDKIHPDSLTGARAMAELAIHLIIKARKEVNEDEEGNDAEAAGSLRGIPKPMIPGNYETMSDKCFIGNRFQETIVKAAGFEWLNDSKGKALKFGYISTKVGSVLEIKVDTRASSNGTAEGTAMGGEGAGGERRELLQSPKAKSRANMVLVQIVHLKSYEGMANALMRCASGCECPESNIEGHQPKIHNSQLYLHGVYVSQSAECVIAITVQRASAGGSKVKISGIIVSEETGEIKGAARTVDSVEMVHTVTLQGGGAFDVRNKLSRPG